MYETVVNPSYRLLGLVDTAVDPCAPDASDSNWLLPAPGMVYLQVPPQVVRMALRLESWSTRPPEPGGDWFGREEVEVEFPGCDLDLVTIDCGRTDIPLILPSPGSYGMRWQWMFNSEEGPFVSPLSWQTLEIPPVREVEFDGADQYCLVQIWRTATAPRAG
ncbi:MULTISPECIES: hypothetical protein [unclassified Streptomyces]|uniref:hypothetical protein n=1 Tax=unclassified Streptomyces TaxID=2593676 RepID=UPI0036699A95